MGLRNRSRASGRASRRRLQDLQILRSFGHDSFRFLWVGAILGSMGAWMQRLAVSWLVLELTGRPLIVGLAYAAYFLPKLVLGPFSGAVADRLNRKRLLVAVQALNVSACLLLAILVLPDAPQVWPVLAIVLLIGTGDAFAMPALQTLIYDIVGPRDAHNGIALHLVGMRFIGAVGAVAGGFLVATVGVGAALLAAVACFTLGLLMISLMRNTPAGRPARSESVIANLMEGLRFFARTPSLASVLVMAMIAESFGFGATSLLPVFADARVLGVGASGLGIMNGAVGVGSMLGASALASAKDLGRKGRLLLLIFLFLGVFVGGFSQSPVFALSVVLLLGVGMCTAAFDAMQIVILQQHVPDEMRGRAMGVWIFCIGTGPAGHLTLGYMAERIGAQNALGISGAIVIAAAIASTAALPQVRSLR